MRRCVRCGTDFDPPGWTCPACGFEPQGSGGVLAFADDAGIDDGFEPEAFEHLAELEEGNFWFRGRNALILWALDAHFGSARSFLEVGCGTGFVLGAVERARPDMTVAGGELFEAGLRLARRRVERAELYQMDARRLPFTDAWDVIGIFDVLEHVDDDVTALAEIHRALRPGGGTLITVPQHPWLWSEADDYGHHQRRYTRAELVGKVRGAGLEPVLVTSFVSLLLPAMAAARLRERVSPRPFDPVAELSLPPRLNRAFERMLRAEIGMIRRGARLPAGGSLLVVAHRR